MPPPAPLIARLSLALCNEVLRERVGLCADLGGRVMVHGSPAQRRVAAGADPAAAWERASRSHSSPTEAAGVT